MFLRRVFKTIALVDNVFVFNKTQQNISVSHLPRISFYILLHLVP